jgi:hypothetical protein
MALLFGLKDIFIFILGLWDEYGFLFALYTAFLFVFIVVRVLIRDHAGEYGNMANVFLFLYIAIPIGYRLLFKRGSLD